MRYEVKKRWSIIPRFLPKATERNWHSQRRDYQRAHMIKKSKSLILKIKFEILTVCFKEEIFLQQIQMIIIMGK